jgi:hypothetical protein
VRVAKHCRSLAPSQESNYQLMGVQYCFQGLRIRDILVWIRIRESGPLTYRSGWILFFSSVTFKTQTKIFFLSQVFLLISF